MTDERRKKLKEAGYSDLQIRAYERDRQRQQPEQKQSFLKEAVKDPFRTLIVKPGTRIGQALTDPTMIGRADVNTAQQDDLSSQMQLLGDKLKRAKTPEEKEKLRATLTNLTGQVKANKDKSSNIFGKMGDQNTNVDLGPAGSYDIQGQQAGMEGFKQIGGDALKTASYLYMPGAAKGTYAGIQQGIKQGFKTGAKQGLIDGTMYGAGSAMEQNQSWGDVGKQAAIGGAIGTVGGAVIGGAIPAIGATYNGAKNAVGTMYDSGKNLLKNNKTLQGVGDVVSTYGKEIAEMPGRFKTNVAAKQAQEAVIKNLPTPTAQSAARNGIEINDISRIYTAPKDQVPALQKLWSMAKDYAQGKGDDPMQAVGKPIVSRLKELDDEAAIVGKQLTQEASNIGPLTSNELYPSVMKKLRDVPGLRGLLVKANGTLDFSNTSLASSLSKSERTEIQKLFNDAIKWGDGTKKHLLRQEIFEQLGGRKSAQVKLTSTQEKAFEAIRDGLADVIVTKRPRYMDLNKQYAQIAQPLKEMRKLMKDNKFVDEDILEMKAGLLARRLTGFAQSNPDVRMLLAALDNATPTKGVSKVSTEALMDFYNILDKYYGLAGKTSFQGQVTAGIEQSSGVGQFVTGKAREMMGETKAVRIKALEDLLSEAWGTTKVPNEVGQYALGAAAGIDTQEGFDPDRAALGVALTTGAIAGGKLAKKLNPEDMGVMETFIDAMRVGGKKGTKQLQTDVKRIADHYGIKGWKTGTELANKFDDVLAKQNYRGTNRTGFTKFKVQD